LETSELFFTDQIDLLELEISRNCIRLSLPPEGISVDELARFLNKKKHRGGTAFKFILVG